MRLPSLRFGVSLSLSLLPAPPRAKVVEPVSILSIGLIELLLEDKPLTLSQLDFNFLGEHLCLYLPLASHCDHWNVDLIFDHPCQLSTFSDKIGFVLAISKTLSACPVKTCTSTMKNTHPGRMSINIQDQPKNMEYKNKAGQT